MSYAIRWCMHTNYRVYFSTQIHLHEPYSKPGSSSCQSALKIITAARAIVDLLHSISSSSFDVSLTDIYPFVSPLISSLSSSRLLRTCTQLSWFMAGRVLVRFLKAAQDAQAEDKVICLKAEIVFLRYVKYLSSTKHEDNAHLCTFRTNLVQAGTRIPLAGMLYNLRTTIIS